MQAPFPPGSTWRTVDVDGPVHLLDMGGPADGPLLVGLHGLGGSHLNWSALGPLLTGRSRMVAVDLVGHGLTPALGRLSDMEGHRRLVSGVLRTLDSPAVLVGNSMGGLVAALQAAAEPETVAGLVLIDPALPTERLGLVHPRVLANFLLCAVPGVGERYLSERRRRTSAEHTVRRVLDTCCADASRVDPEVVDAHIRLTASLDREAGDTAYLGSARSLASVLARPADTLRRLAGIDRPTLLLHGDRDVLVPVAAARRMGEAHPDWRLDIAPGIGHIPMLEAPVWTAETIEHWLGHEGSLAAERASARRPALPAAGPATAP